MGYYIESGKVDVKRLIIVFPLALLIALLIAYLYAHLSYYTPGFLRIILVLIYSVLISGTGYLMIQKSNIRQGKIRIIFFSTLVIFAWISAWCFYLALHFDLSVFKIIGRFPYYFSQVSSAWDFVFSYLYLFWIAEAMLLIFLPIRLAYKPALKDVLFCEKCNVPITNQLNRHLVYTRDYSADELVKMIDNQTQGDFTNQYRTGKDDPVQHEVVYAFCGNCDEPVYMSVIKHFQLIKNNHPVKKTEKILDFYALDQSIQWKDLVNWPTQSQPPPPKEAKFDDFDEIDEAF